MGKTIDIGSFPEIPHEYAEILRSKGINNSEDLLGATKTNEASTQLGKATGIPLRRIQELHSLCLLVSEKGLSGPEARKQYQKQ